MTANETPAAKCAIDEAIAYYERALQKQKDVKRRPRAMSNKIRIKDLAKIVWNLKRIAADWQREREGK